MRPVDELPYLEWSEPSGEIKRLYADAWVQEEVTLPAVVTQHAVESASKITDHYRKDPRTVRVELFFSGSPVRGDLDEEFPGAPGTVSLSYREYPANVSLQGAISAVAGALGVPPRQPLPSTMTALRFDQPPGARLAKALELIDRLQTEGILLTVGGSMLRLESMGVVNCVGHRDASSGDGGSIALDLVQLTFTSSDVAVAISLPQPTIAAAQSKRSANAGAPAGLSGPGKTAAASLFDAVF